MPTFKLTMAYDGTDFAGWQWQPNKRTVQGELEATLAQIVQEPVKCLASGRTDAGVHALGQVVSFDANTRHSGDALCKALNAELPDDMLVFEAIEVPGWFQAMQNAIGKRYRYVVQDGRLPDIFARKYVWHIRRRLDVEAMQAAAEGLIGTHDFKSYQTTGSSRLNTIRTVFDIFVQRQQAELTDRVTIEVAADGFLFNMVRNIAGTLVEVGKGKQPIGWPAEVLTKRDRREAGVTAPPQGLFLVGVDYLPLDQYQVRDEGLNPQPPPDEDAADLE